MCGVLAVTTTTFYSLLSQVSLPHTSYKLWFQYVALGRSKSVVPHSHMSPKSRCLTTPSSTEIGVALTTFGALFMLLGVMLFFDGALLALGNVCLFLLPRLFPPLPDIRYNRFCFPRQILFVSGLTLIIGPQKTFYFFARKQKIRGTVCFLGGILLVFLKWPFIGMVVETFGFLNLFGCVVVLYTFDWR